MNEKRSRLPSWKVVVGVVISVALLYYALRDVHPSEVMGEMRRADPWLLLAAVVATSSMFFWRALRWGPLVQPVAGKTSLHARFAATCIGFMANNLLPARVGEVARAFALSRMQPIPVSASIASLVVERILDGIVIIGFLFLAMAMPSFPEVATVGGREIGGTALLLLVVFAVMILLLLMTVLWPERAVRVVEATGARLLPMRLRTRALSILATFVTGLGVLRRPALLASAVAWSLVHWLVGALSFWLAFFAFGIDVPFSAALFLQSITGLAVALPAAPGFFGVYEAAFRVGLVDVWGIDAGKAVSCAIGFHIGGFIPVTVVGLLYAWRVGISLRGVAKTATAPPPGPAEA